MGLFPQDEKDKPSVKKIIFYSILIPVVLIAVGFIGERLGLV